MVSEDNRQPITEICGIDEAGRGALAGPVCAAAVQLGAHYPPAYRALLADSKRLSPQKREARAEEIVRYAARWAVSWASAEEVDSHNVLRAALLAMRRAYLLLCSLPPPPPLIGAAGGWAMESNDPAAAAACPLPRLIIVDGPHAPTLGPTLGHHAPPPGYRDPMVRAVIKADATISAVQAASILAKTHRDAWMITQAHRSLPQYGFNAHKGYPTALHRKQIATHGPSPLHRMSFRGVRP